MTEPETTPRRGRRARELSPEESAALEARATMETTREPQSAPGVRGAVAPPTADAQRPALRKFGRRARIIELSEEPTPGNDAAPATAEGGSTNADARPTGWSSVSSPSPGPEPRPAPRFDGKVLHRPERSTAAPVWLVWALIAIAIIVLVALLLTGVIGPSAASAADAALLDLFIDRPVLEEAAA